MDVTLAEGYSVEFEATCNLAISSVSKSSLVVIFYSS
jgi:hypothetical protein